MHDAPADRAETEPRATHPHQPTGPDDPVRHLAAQLAQPGLLVLTGAPGTGRTTTLRAVADSFPGPVCAGGGLAILRTVPALALSRAVRARLPTDDQALTAEAVRSRVRSGLLIIDDLQWADPLTLATLPSLAEHCRILAALRTPHRLPDTALHALRRAATDWVALPPLNPEQATALAQRTAPGLGPTTVAEVVARAGGVPLAVQALARHAATRPTPQPTTSQSTDTNPDTVTHAVAEALADLPRPARTAMAALGLLRRPAARHLLGTGVDELLDAGLATTDPTMPGEQITAVSPYVAEVAAGLLTTDERTALHRRLADLVPDAEAAQHLAAAGEDTHAYHRALSAADAATTTGHRATLLLLACDLPGAPPEPTVRLQAAAAALSTGRPRAALRALAETTEAHATLLRGEALLQLGDAAAATTTVTSIPDTAGPDLTAGRDRIQLLAALVTNPALAAELAAKATTRHGHPSAHTGLRAALAAADATARTPGWEHRLATATATAGAAGDTLAAHWSAWLLVETLAADGRLAEAADNARLAATACAADLAYSWQTRFLAAELWCTALRGEHLDEVIRRAVNLVDHTLPAIARGYATAAASLAEADGGLLASARARLANTPPQPPATVADLLDWVADETAWLDGQPELIDGTDLTTQNLPLLAGLRQITRRWAAHDQTPTARHPDPPPDPHTPPPVRATLDAWHAVHTDPARATEFAPAAVAWHDVARREEIRCLLAHGLHAREAADAVPPLLRAEQLAEQSGLVVLLGRTHRALRRHAVRREARGPRAGTELTDRERDVLRLVAHGEPTRRIAGLLGISRETVETHIRAGMRKLGARTRTEAAGLALELLH